MKFKRHTLSELATIKYGKNQKKVVTDDKIIPIYGTGGLMGYATMFLYDKPSVLIGRKGSIGKVKYVEHPFWTVDTLFYTVINTDIVIPKYLFYSMSLIDLNNYNEGTTIPSLRTETLNRLEFNIPSIEDQKLLLSCLNPIDEKIELNNAINNNLEQQAQALMMDYCDKVYDTAPLETVMSLINGFAFKSSTYLSNGAYRVITIKNVQDGKVDTRGASFIDSIPSQMKHECNLQIGDVILSLTGNVGRVGIVCEDNLLLNQRVAKFQPFDRRNLPFLYFYYRLPETKTRLETLAKGTAQANLSPVETLKLEFPFNQQLMSELSYSLRGIISIIENNQIQNLALAEMRDTLLPKLMSDELDVSKIEN